MMYRLYTRSNGFPNKMNLTEKGNDIIRPAKPEEIIPNKMQYYGKCSLGGSDFVLTSFAPVVEWEAIVALCKHGHIFVKVGFK